MFILNQTNCITSLYPLFNMFKAGSIYAKYGRHMQIQKMYVNIKLIKGEEAGGAVVCNSVQLQGHPQVIRKIMLQSTTI